MDEIPEFVAIGPVTRDVVPGGGWRLGGTVTFAAHTATRLGMRAGIVTAAPADLADALRAALPEVALAAHFSDQATTFENSYTESGRHQLLLARARMLTVADIPPGWLDAPIVLLAPLAAEVDPALAAASASPLLAATPQGWMRGWDAAGRVRPRALTDEEEAALEHVQALLLSREDVGWTGAGGPADDAARRQIADWARRIPLVAVTCGPGGADLYQRAVCRHFTGYPARELDPTGAGDVFAAAFLYSLHRQGHPHEAMDFANKVAACSVEAEGNAGIPTLAALAARFPNTNS